VQFGNDGALFKSSLCVTYIPSLNGNVLLNCAVCAAADDNIEINNANTKILIMIQESRYG